MLRSYYSGIHQGFFLQLGMRECLVPDHINAVVERPLQRIEMYSSQRFMTVDELLNDSIDAPMEYDHPWEAFGTIPTHSRDTLEASLMMPSWWESHWPQAYQSFQWLCDEVKALLARETYMIVNGPDKGDCVRLETRECRVAWNDSIYQKVNEKDLIYVRPV